MCGRFHMWDWPLIDMSDKLSAKISLCKNFTAGPSLQACEAWQCFCVVLRCAVKVTIKSAFGKGMAFACASMQAPLYLFRLLYLDCWHDAL